MREISSLHQLDALSRGVLLVAILVPNQFGREIEREKKLWQLLDQLQSRPEYCRELIFARISGNSRSIASRDFDNVRWAPELAEQVRSLPKPLLLLIDTDFSTFSGNPERFVIAAVSRFSAKEIAHKVAPWLEEALKVGAPLEFLRQKVANKNWDGVNPILIISDASAGNANAAAPAKPKGGRPAMINAGNGDTIRQTWLDLLNKNGGVETRGMKTIFAERVRPRLPQQFQTSTLKSILKALNEAGIFARAKAADD